MGLRAALCGRPLGFGGAPLGNTFREVPDEVAAATVDAAWQAGTRYFDTAPFYGAGLSEIRLGRQLARHHRDQYLLSTKVGRLVLSEHDMGRADLADSGLFAVGRTNEVVYDYTATGTLKSIEDSLQRLGVDRIDFVWIHDIAQDFHGDDWLTQFETARTGAFRALTRLRDERVISGWGLAVNRTEPIELLLGLSEAQPDGSLLAGRYTLLDHKHALQRLMPTAQKQGVDIVAGGPYSSGIITGGAHFGYQNTSTDIAAKVESMKAVAARHNVPINAAALQFCLAHPATVAVIAGASRPERIAEDNAALKAVIPQEFWQEMRRRNLLAADAPLPIDRVSGFPGASSSTS
jgi:D-threo-aldose 1-dehydrogenase